MATNDDHGSIGGESVQARSADGAAAVAAALSGVEVGEAYQRQGIVLPEIGTQVAHLVAPDALKAGDVGMRTGDLVMALGNGNVLAAGQVQPIDSVSSRPDFLGWFDPTKPHKDSAGH